MRNKKQMNDQQRALVIENMDFADKLAANYKGKGVMLCDLQQEARLALCYVAMRFDPDKGIKLTTFATLYINGCLCKYIMRYGQPSYLSKEQRVFVRMVSLESFRGNNEDDDSNWEDFVRNPNADEDAEKQEAVEIVETLMESLDDNERKILTMQYCLDDKQLSLAEQAEQMGMSISTLLRCRREIMQKLRLTAEKLNIER